MPNKYELNIFSPLLLGSELITTLTDWAVGWRRSYNIYQGCKVGTFRLYPDKGYHLNDLEQAFYEWVGCLLAERSSGLPTWTGIVYSLDFVSRGDIRRKTLENVNNAVKAVYTDDGITYAETSWYTDANSTSRLGRKESILQMLGYSLTAAQQKAQAVLKFSSKPYSRMVDIGTIDNTYLEVSVLGYASTVNWRYVTAQDNAIGNANVWVSNILSTDCELVLPGVIRTNAVQIKRKNLIQRKALDTLISIAELGDASYNPWQIYIDCERKLHYRPIDLTAKYIWRDGLVYTMDGDLANPWTIEPGVVRNADYPTLQPEPGTPLLSDVRDALVEEVEISSDGTIVFRNQDAEELSIMAAQQEYEKILADEEKNK